MNRESGSEQTQRTVAELLAQYGANSPDAAPRRRRRRADDVTDTAPQTIIERVTTESGPLMPIRDEPVPVNDAPKAPRRAPRYSDPEDPAERTAYQPPIRPEPRRQVPPALDLTEQTTQVPPIKDGYQPEPSRSKLLKPEPSRSNLPKPEPSRPNLLKPEPSRSNLPKPEPSRPNIARPAPVAKPAGPKPVIKPPAQVPPHEPVTEVLPRIADKPHSAEATALHEPVALPGEPPAGLAEQTGDWFGDDDVVEQERTQAHPGPYVDDDYSPDLDLDEEPAGLSDAEDEEEAPRSPAKEWLVMIGQLAAGVLGGAGLWLGFNWLWRSVPAAALVVALAVTVGLVLLVRKIRKADDLQTTVLAVLVGLIVTVSPAAMLLVKS